MSQILVEYSKFFPPPTVWTWATTLTIVGVGTERRAGAVWQVGQAVCSSVNNHSSSKRAHTKGDFVGLAVEHELILWNKITAVNITTIFSS